MTTIPLSEKINKRREYVNKTCNEYTQAIAHTSFNQVEEDVKQAIQKTLKELKDKFEYWNFPEGEEVEFSAKDIIEIIDTTFKKYFGGLAE